MNKRLLLITFTVLIVLVVFIVLNITMSVKKGKTEKTDIASAPNALLLQVRDLEAKGNLLDAKVTYQRLINEFPNSGEIVSWQKKVEELNIRLLFSPLITPKSTLYVISPGDTLTKIARDFKTTPELIMKSNHLPSDKILPGRKIKVWTAPFSIVVDKSQNTLVLKSDEEIVKTYVVSTGTNNSTPTGKFKIVNKLMNPTWFKTGIVVPSGSPENILGSRWLGFDIAGYGIHGNHDPQSLGKQATQGCVRMSNSDVEELYTIVPIGAEVTIVD